MSSLRLGARSSWVALLAIAAWYGLPRLSLAPALELSAFWFALAIAPGVLWSRFAEERRDGEPIAEILLLGFAHATVLSGLSLMLRFGIGAGTHLVPLSLLLAWGASTRGTARAPGGRQAWLRFPLLLALALGVWMAIESPAVHIRTDAPAHIAAVRDAFEQEAWRPLDLSIPGSAGGQDPRFGILHGIYAFAARHCGLDPAEAVRSSAVFLSPAAFLLHLALFRRFLGTGNLSVVAALLFVLQAGAGRGFGLWSVVYPGNAASMIGAGCMAVGIPYLRRERGLAGWPLVAALILGISCLVHLFSWWAWLMILAHAALICLLVSRLRVHVRPILTFCLIAGATGVLLRIPEVLAHLNERPGPHHVPVAVIFITETLFFTDPSRVARWGGVLSILALPLLMIHRRLWFVSVERVLLVSTALVVWTISLDPLIAPASYRVFGYFAERLGALVYVPVVFTILLIGLRDRLGSARSGFPRIVTACLAAGLFLLYTWNLANDVQRLRGASSRTADYWGGLAAAADALEESQATAFLADPRTSYGLRALRGGTTALYPLAHASPLDVSLPARLTSYRRLLSPETGPDDIAASVAGLGVSHVVVNEHLERLYQGPEYGFVARAADQSALRAKLDAAGAVTVAQGDGWSLYEIAGVAAVDSSEAGPSGSYACVRIEAIGDAIVRGDELQLRLTLRRAEEPSLWQGVYLRGVQAAGEASPLPQFLERTAQRVRERLLGADRRRFAGWRVPFAGLHDVDAWDGGEMSTIVGIRIPPNLEPGRYRIMASAHELQWASRRHLEEFWSTEDLYTSDVFAEIQVVRDP